jgi:hypothetical protein
LALFCPRCKTGTWGAGYKDGGEIPRLARDDEGTGEDIFGVGFDGDGGEAGGVPAAAEGTGVYSSVESDLIGWHFSRSRFERRGAANIG